jgi:MFS family permease
VVAAFLVAMAGTTLPTPLYPSYEHDFGFGGLTVTVVFATYALGVIGALLLFGQASDAVGRKPVLFAGLGLSALSAIAFLLAPSVGGLALLLAGRLLSGLSAGLYTGTATAALLDLAEPSRRARTALLAAVANMLGLGLGPLTAGFMTSWGPRPERSVYAADLVLVVAVAIVLGRCPEPHGHVEDASFRPSRPRLPSRHQAAFLRAGVLGAAGFAVLGLFTSLAPLFLGDVLDVKQPWATGVVVFLVFASSAIGQFVSVKATNAISTGLALVGLPVAMALVAASLLSRSLLLLLVAGLMSGLAQGAGFRATLTAATSLADEETRGQVTSAYFTILYLGISFPIVGMGLMTQAWSLTTAGLTFAATVTAVALALLAYEVVGRAEPASD